MADLYAGLELPRKKRPAAAEADDAGAHTKNLKDQKTAAQEVDAAQEQQQQRKRPRSDAPLDTAATVAKLQGYMVRAAINMDACAYLVVILTVLVMAV